jgi:hypothetical protein
MRGVQQTVEGRKWRYKLTLPRKVDLWMTILGHILVARRRAAGERRRTTPDHQSQVWRQILMAVTELTCHRHLTSQGRQSPVDGCHAGDISLSVNPVL